MDAKLYLLTFILINSVLLSQFQIATVVALGPMLDSKQKATPSAKTPPAGASSDDADSEGLSPPTKKPPSSGAAGGKKPSKSPPSKTTS